MKISYFVPHLNTIYAGRTIYMGYRNAFTLLGHEFEFITADSNLKEHLYTFKPNIVFFGLNLYNYKFIDFPVLKQYKKDLKCKIVASIPYWKYPFSGLRINESIELEKDTFGKRLLKEGLVDLCFNVYDSDDERMSGFEGDVGIKWLTLPLGVDTTLLSDIKPDYSKYGSDICFVGTNLPEKRESFNRYVFPLKIKHKLSIYGQDWNNFDKYLGLFQKVGMYFNIPYLKNIQKPKLQVIEELNIYASSVVSINVHEDNQKKYGGDCNERTFKIPASGGFEVTDNVRCISKYFIPDKEIIIGENNDDWVQKIEYYLKYPEKRVPIIAAGMERARKDHSYVNRVNSVLSRLLK